MEENYQPLFISFQYNDENGYGTSVQKHIPENLYDTPLELLVDEFKAFLLACGFHHVTVDKIVIEE